jgi:SAM-dependent methyltransferase
MIKSARVKLRSEGAAGLLHSLIRRTFPSALSGFENCRPYVEGRIGLEVGGPSAIFERRGLMPAYRIAARIDNSNFSPDTAWESGQNPGLTFKFNEDRPPGRQFIAEAAALGFSADASYDFLLSSHMLEHSANPIRVLEEWKRVLKPGGLLLLVLPHKDNTFDHRRPTSTLDHLKEDFAQEMGEDDLSHLPEILQLHDLDRDQEAGDAETFHTRCQDNFHNRCLHQHVFDTELATALVDHLRFQILITVPARPYHIVIAAIKPHSAGKPDNRRFLGADADWRRSSPFRSDWVR